MSKKEDSFLRKIRKGKEITTNKVAEYMHCRYPRYAISTYDISYIFQFEKNLRALWDAVEGKEPERSIFCLYLEPLNLNDEEEEQVRKYLEEPNFNFKPDEDVLRRVLIIPKSINVKLNAIPERNRKRITDLINRLYVKNMS